MELGEGRLPMKGWSFGSTTGEVECMERGDEELKIGRMGGGLMR